MPIPHDAARLITLDGTVYRVSARTLIAIELAGPQEGRDILLDKGYALGSTTDFERLVFKAGTSLRRLSAVPLRTPVSIAHASGK